MKLFSNLERRPYNSDISETSAPMRHYLRFDSGFFPKSDAVYLEFSMILQNTLYAIYIVKIRIQSVSNKVSPRSSEFPCKHTMVAGIIC